MVSWQEIHIYFLDQKVFVTLELMEFLERFFLWFFLYHLPRFELIVNINNLNIYFIFSLRSGCTTQWREPRMSTMEERISIALKNSSSLESSRPNSNPRKSHFNYNLHTFSVSDSKKLFLDFSFIKIYARVIIIYIYIYI